MRDLRVAIYSKLRPLAGDYSKESAVVVIPVGHKIVKTIHTVRSPGPLQLDPDHAFASFEANTRRIRSTPGHRSAVRLQEEAAIGFGRTLSSRDHDNHANQS